MTARSQKKLPKKAAKKEKVCSKAVGEQADPAVGRKPEYQPKIHCPIAKKILELYGTEVDVANAIGVSQKTIYNWKKKHKDFRLVVEEAKGHVDLRMIQTLARLGLGEVKVKEQKAIKVKVGKDKEQVKTVFLYREIPPDLGAVKMWLINRRPADFREKQVLEHEGGDLPQVILYQPDISATPEQYKGFIDQALQVKEARAKFASAAQPVQEDDEEEED